MSESPPNNVRMIKKADRKAAIIELLTDKTEPLKAPCIKEALGWGDEYQERTVRRDLQELVSEGVVARKGKTKDSSYSIVTAMAAPQATPADNKKAIPLALAITGPTIGAGPGFFSASAQEIVDKVRADKKFRAPVSYNAEWVNGYIPNQTFWFSEEQLATMKKQGKRNVLGSNIEPAGTYSRKILNRLLIDLSYNSSRLEGNTYSELDTKKLLLEGIEQEGKLDNDRVMIINHKDAIRFLVNNAESLEIEYSTITTLHYLLSDGLLVQSDVGKIRSGAVFIGESVYSPWEGKARLEKQLKQIIHTAAQIENPYEQSIYLLANIAYLQAFEDVNKRTSRLSANIPLIKANVVPLSFNDIDKEDYVSAMLSVYELNDSRPLVDLYYHSYLRTCRQYDATIEAVGFSKERVLYRTQRREAIAKVVKDNVHGEEARKTVMLSLLSIPDEDHNAFMDIVMEDLEELAIETIAGMGITGGEFNKWKEGEGSE